MMRHASIDSDRQVISPAVLASQSLFRCAMNAMARPGTICSITHAVAAPPKLMPGTAALAQALFDHDTPVWLDERFSALTEAMEWLRFQTSAPLISDLSRAAFAMIDGGTNLPEFESFALGTLEYPDRSTTLIVQIETLVEGPELLLRGPGIRDSSRIHAGGLPPDFAERMQANRALFPRGVDLLLVCGAQLVALPRSTHVAAGGA